MNKSNVTIAYQSYGSSILVFFCGDTDEETNGRYLSFWNWNGTSSEPERVSEGIISCWSTIDRLKKYLFNMRVNQLTDAPGAKLKGKKNGVRDEAAKLAAEDFAAIEREKYRSINSNFEEHTFGKISASNPDDSMEDYFVTRGLQAR